jgi:glycosyltransferase involved in cell wall biosynthesis
MKPKYSIITTCMGRLDHLKESLPRMLGQPDTEVIVVDWSCPQNTAAHVAKHFPKARVVKVEGKDVFSNWAARNAGAAEAKGDVLIFCDADTVLKPDALGWIGENLKPGMFGHFSRDATTKFNTTRLRLGFNQLRGFHALPAQAFRKFDGYDDVLEGYAAGADTDLETRMVIFGFKRLVIDPEIVERVVEHDNEDRFRHHNIAIRTSYAAGYFYRKAKTALIRLRRVPNLPLPLRQNMYSAAKKAAAALDGRTNSVNFKVDLEREAIGMPLQLGFRKAQFKMSLQLNISGEGAMDEIPTHIDEGGKTEPRT